MPVMTEDVVKLIRTHSEKGRLDVLAVRGKLTWKQKNVYLQPVKKIPAEKTAEGHLLWNSFENRKIEIFSGRKTRRPEFGRKPYHDPSFLDCF